MINKNKLFRQLHIYVSLFFLPVALLYAISGFAYILGANQDVGAKIEQWRVNATLSQENAQESALEILKAQNIKIPKDSTLRENKRGGGFWMGAVHYSLAFKQDSPNELTITATTRSLLGDMIMLHKDKGAWYFSVIAIGFALALVLFYISGLIITLFASKKDRKPQIFAIILGFLTCALVGYASV